jgi:hypothetical protein
MAKIRLRKLRTMNVYAIDIPKKAIEQSMLEAIVLFVTFALQF